MKRRWRDSDDDELFHSNCVTTTRREIPTRASIKHKAEQAKETWLDELQAEIRTRIALHLNNDSRDDDSPCKPAQNIFALSEVSEKQRVAVAEALLFVFRYEEHHSWNAWHVGYDANIKLASVIRDHVRHVNFGSRGAQEFQYLLKEPTLRSATISNRPNLLRVLPHAPQLRELRLLMTSKSNFSNVSKALKKLNLTKLHLECAKWRWHWGGFCMRTLLADPTNCAQLVAAQSNITSLGLVCSCHRYSSDFLPSLLSAFKNLRNLSFTLRLSDDVIPALQRLDSVVCQTTRDFSHFAVCSDQLVFAHKVGHAVTGLETIQPYDFYNFPPMRERDNNEVGLLVNCPRLKTLSLRLVAGAEDALPELAELECLDLCWNPLLLHVYDLLKKETLTEVYHEPLQSFFFRLLSTSPNIREVRLFKVRISMENVDRILERYGERLEAFGTSVKDQDESACERILLLFNSVRKHTPNLRHLDFCKTQRKMVRFGEMVEWRERVSRGLQILRRRMPYLDLGRLSCCINDAIGENFLTDNPQATWGLNNVGLTYCSGYDSFGEDL